MSSIVGPSRRDGRYVRQFKQYVRGVDPAFDERKLGFTTIMEFLRLVQREGLFRLERDRRGQIRVFPGQSRQSAPVVVPPAESESEEVQAVLEPDAVEVQETVEAEMTDGAYVAAPGTDTIEIETSEPEPVSPRRPRKSKAKVARKPLKRTQRTQRHQRRKEAQRIPQKILCDLCALCVLTSRCPRLTVAADGFETAPRSSAFLAPTPFTVSSASIDVGLEACHLAQRRVMEDDIRRDAARARNFQSDRTQPFEEVAIDVFSRFRLDARLRAWFALSWRPLAGERQSGAACRIFQELQSFAGERHDRAHRRSAVRAPRPEAVRCNRGPLRLTHPANRTW